MGSAWESVHLAVVDLVAETNIKQRLVKSFSSYLIDLDSSALPRAARGEFDALRRSLTQVAPLRGESSVAATVRKMSNEEAGACAQRIVRLLALVRSDYVAEAEEQRLRPVVKLFSAEA